MIEIFNFKIQISKFERLHIFMGYWGKFEILILKIVESLETLLLHIFFLFCTLFL